jgi:hypothetical protein
LDCSSLQSTMFTTVLSIFGWLSGTTYLKLSISIMSGSGSFSLLNEPMGDGAQVEGWVEGGRETSSSFSCELSSDSVATDCAANVWEILAPPELTIISCLCAGGFFWNQNENLCRSQVYWSKAWPSL